MEKNTECLFKPFKLAGLELNNRIVMAPMTRMASPNHVPNDQVVEYYRRRAAGNVGLIITEGTCINHKASNGYSNVPSFFGEDALAGWAKVVKAVHAEGGKIAPQIWHVGSVRKAKEGPEQGVPPYSPSGLLTPDVKVGVEMTQTDIDEVVAAYAQAAKDAQRLGFDAVEIHGAHGYLIDQFFWAGTNQRTDKYGGLMANRQRFALEVITAVRAAVTEDFPVIFRWSQWKLQDYKARLVENSVELAEFIEPLSEAGVDIFHCSTRRFWEPEFENSDLNLAGWVKKITGKPTISVGSVGLDSDFLSRSETLGKDVLFDSAELKGIDELIARMSANEFDLIAVGRALISNPDWVRKVAKGDFSTLKPYNQEDVAALV